MKARGRFLTIPGKQRDRFRHTLARLLTVADVEIGGDRPWDIQVHNEGLYARWLAGGSLGVGESYMDGWWDCPCFDECAHRILLAEVDRSVTPWAELFDLLKAKLLNLQSFSRASRANTRHYNIGNKLYRLMLGERLIYSCAYWKEAATLDEAQEAKLQLVCQKLGLKPGMRVLDIGCGWGGAAKFAAERYRVEVVGITVSEAQARFAQEFCRGLAVDIRLQDYRSLREPFDRIFSLGMLEHVGYKNYPTFMRMVRGCLKDDDGLFVLQTIGSNRSVVKNDPWAERYVFPNSMLPSATQISAAAEGLFVIEDWHNFGADYDRTLMQWFRNFDDHWEVLSDDYDERFYRMWKYYLLSFAGTFRARRNQLWQIVLSPKGVLGGYHAPR